MIGVNPGFHYTQYSEIRTAVMRMKLIEGRKEPGSYELRPWLRPLMAFHFCRFLNITFASLGMRIEPT